MTTKSSSHPPDLASSHADWPVVRVDDLFQIQQGKQVSKKNRVGDNQRPFLRTRNVYWGRLDLSDLDEMHFTESDEARLALRDGDLLLCEGGSVGRTAVWGNEISGCYYQNHLHRLRVLNGEADPHFAMYWFWYAFEVGGVYFGRKNVTTIPNMSKSRLAELPMPRPAREEQTRISAVLTAVRQAIEQQEQLISLTIKLKTALMHRLFTEGVRGESQRKSEIGRLPENWGVAALVDVAESFKYGTSVKCGYKREGVPVLRIPNVVGGHVDVEDLKYGTPKPTEIGPLKLREGDLLFVRTNGVQDNAGRCSIYRGELGAECCFASYLIRVRTRRDQLCPEFLDEYTRTQVGRSFLAGRAIRTADGKFNINSGTLQRMVVPVPDLEEQHKIADAAAVLDKKLGVHIARRRELEGLFRALLHLLMSAQIRVKSLDPQNLGLDAADSPPEEAA